MSYAPLALKYRPRAFSDMVGQEHITEALRAAIEGGRVAHAYLFAGPRGTGKTTTARILARCLNCEEGPTADPCGDCVSCRAVTDGVSLDVLELDAASQRKVEETEDWISSVHLVPMGRYKVYIIDEVHMFSRASFNLLLKTFEEPPAHVVFVLATTEPDKVPATVRGRCQRYDFRLVPFDALVGRYHTICEAEGIEPEAGSLELAARQAAGSVRDGITLLEQAISDDGSRVELARVRSLTGAVDRELVERAIDLMAAGDSTGIFPLVAQVSEAGADLRRFTEDLVAYMRGVMLSAAGADPARLLDEIDDAAAKEMARHGELMGTEGATARLTLLAEVAREVDNEALGRITLEAALVRCCLAGAAPSDDLAVRVAALEARLAGSRPEPVVHGERAAAPTPSPEEPRAILSAELGIRWHDVVASLGPVMRALLDGSHALGFDGSVLRVGVDQDFKVTKLAARRDEIDTAAARIFGSGGRVVFEVAGPSSDAGDTHVPPVGETEVAEGPPVDASTVVEMVKQGFAAEVVEEYNAE